MIIKILINIISFYLMVFLIEQGLNLQDKYAAWIVIPTMYIILLVIIFLNFGMWNLA